MIGRVAIGVLPLGFALLPSGVAFAQPGGNPACPPGAYCDSTLQPDPLPPLPPAGGKPVADPSRPGGPIPEKPPVYPYQPRPWYDDSARWGVNLHLQAMLIGRGAADNAGMGALGFGFRYKFNPSIGLEANIDFAGGRDYMGDKRGESIGTVNFLFFVNPRSKVQLYFLFGGGGATARVENDTPYFTAETNRLYLGGQGGAGVEFRLSEGFAINVDARAFLRTRVDGDKDVVPEFVDDTGRTSNLGIGSAINGGVTFYF